MESKNSVTVNYRKAGLIMTPFVLAGLTLAYIFNAPSSALITIGVCGLGCAFILIALGNKAEKDIEQ